MNNANKILSDCFPPDYDKEVKYLAKVHEVIKPSLADLDLSQIYLRAPKSSEDVEEIKLLFAEWYPVEYPDAFYNSILDIKNAPRTILALIDLPYQETTQTVILGCLVYEEHQVDGDIVGDLPYEAYDQCRSVYLMALGVINEMRNKGLGKILLNKLIESVEEDVKLLYIYLDVIEHNKSGIDFYNRNNFKKIRVRENYYEIGDKEYDGWVYCFNLQDHIEVWRTVEIPHKDTSSWYAKLVKSLKALCIKDHPIEE